MTDQSSSLVEQAYLEQARPPATWRRVAHFAARPRLPERISGLTRASVVATLKLYALDMVLMGLVLCVFLAVEIAGVELPSNELEAIDLGPVTIALIVLGAPLGEEIAFRGWLSGRPGALWPITLLAIVLVGSAAFGERMGPAVQAVFVLGGIGLAGALAYIWHARPPHRWFARAFPVFFWLSALAFAAIHLGNYAETEKMLWPLVIPQFLAGILFAYARVHYGLWSSIVLHILHNATLVALVLAGGAIAGGAGGPVGG